MKMGRGVCAHLRAPSFYFISDAHCALLPLPRAHKRCSPPGRGMSHGKGTRDRISFSQMNNACHSKIQEIALKESLSGAPESFGTREAFPAAIKKEIN